MTKLTKQGIVFQVMNDNADKPMSEVLNLIVSAIEASGLPGKGVDYKRAKAYYTDAVKKGLAPGKAEKTVRAPRVAKAATPKAPKLIKPKLDKSIMKDRKPITDKTVEEIADIRAKNLARLKAVGKKYAKGQYADGARGRQHTDEEARAEVTNLENSLDSFQAPAFLNMDQVRALV